MPNTRKKRANPQRLPGPTAGRPPLHLNAAGIDVGSAEPYVAVPRIARQRRLPVAANTPHLRAAQQRFPSHR